MVSPPPASRISHTPSGRRECTSMRALVLRDEHVVAE